MKPKKILELGLGQSTKLISQYVKGNDGVTHSVIENNSDWINFFTNTYSLPLSAKIVKLDWKMVPYKDEEVRVFDGFKESLRGEKFGGVR